MAKVYKADYQAEINAAVKKGDYAKAAELEQERNEKIAVTGSSQKQTNLYSQYLNGGSSASSTGSKNSGVSSSSGLLGSAAGAMDRAVGVGGKGTQNLGAYKDANGNTTTYRPEFAGQTVQLGNQYVTYNERGYPVKSTGVKHAQSLGNAYTSQNMGLDQTKISNAADIYQGIYNAAMKNNAIVSGSGLNNAYGKRNIQYNSGLTLQDYDKLISDAAGRGNYLLAGFYEDSRNAAIADGGMNPNLQSSTYNGGWNYVDNGGGVGNIYTGALKDPVQTDQALGGGWYAGLGKGDPEEEYFYLNTDAPTMQEILAYARMKGYNTEDENETVPVGALAREMMASGYVSPKTMQKAQTLKITVPAALRNLGIESNSSGTEALDRAIATMQSTGGGLYTKAVQGAQNQNAVNGLYSNASQKAAQSAGGTGTNIYSQYLNSAAGGSTGGIYGGNSLENELLNLYGNGGLYNQALADTKALIDANVARIAAQYEGQKGNVSSSYDDVARQLYIDRENAQKNIGQLMAAQGATGGTAESTLLGLNTSYQEALRESEQERINTLNELDQAIQQAKLTGDISFAEQALALAQQRADNYAGVLQMMLSRQDAAEQQAYNQQMAKADLLASMGDFSGYSALGLTDAQIAALGKNYVAQNTPKASSGGGGGYTKPTLTFNQAKELLKDGVVNDTTLYAYEYYAGEPWKSTYDKLLEKTNASTGTSFSGLHEAFGTGHPEKAVARIDELWETLTEPQRNEVRGIAAQYGYLYQR